MQRFMVGLAASLVCIAYSAYAVEIQDFANDPTPDGWVGFNNTVHSNSYGWSSATNHTNNDAALGEAGGFVARTDGDVNGGANNYYADTTLAGPLKLDDPLSASGWFRFHIPTDTVPDPNLHFGFFYREAVELPQDNNNAIGFVLADQSSTQMRVGARVVDDGGTNIFSSFAVLDHQTNYYFDLDYDPSANSGVGVLTLTIDDDSNSGNGVLHTLTVNLTAGQRTSNATLTAFGLVNFNGAGTPGQSFFFDDLIYTSNQIVPEPASLGLAGIGAITLVVARRRTAARTTR